MTLIDHVLPLPRQLETDSVDLALPSDQAWAVVRQVDLGENALTRALFALRNLAAREATDRPHLRIDELVSSAQRPGFQVLAEEPGREVVVGAIGKVWKLDIPFVHVDSASDFAAFQLPDFVKVAWALRVTPLDGGRSRVTVEVRVDATDDRSWRRFKRYFLVVGPGSHFIRRAFLKGLARSYGAPPHEVDQQGSADDWRDVASGIGGAALMSAALLTPFLRVARSHWGLGADEEAKVYPGDDLVPTPRWRWTHAVEIGAPASSVWPWIAQIGADKAGFYSYQWLENVAGCHVRNAESVHPEWEVTLGSPLLLHPKAPPLHIERLERGSWFVAYAGGAPGAPRAAGAPWAAASWLFLLQSAGAERSRLISRYRCACSDDLATRISFGSTLMEPIGFAMDRRMLLGVRQRAEGAPR